MESQAPSRTSTQIGDAESTTRRNLGLDGPSPSSSTNDPLKMARQAIRSQVTAREYTERQLDQAQGTIQDLRSKLRHVLQEKEAAVNAAQLAMVARDAAERKMRAAESALANERAGRIRTEGMLRDAEETIRGLREKLAIANQNLHSTQAELSAMRLAHQLADDAVIVLAEAKVPTIPEGELPVVRTPVGRPRKTVTVQPIQPPSAKAPAISSNIECAGQIVRRPVGRPRKMVVAESTPTSTKQSRKLKAVGKTTAQSAAQKHHGRRSDDQEAVRWWVEGWRER